MTNIAAVGLGEDFGLVRFGGPSIGEGLQLDVIEDVFAQFDLGAPSNDLINADYVIGVPLTFRRRVGLSLCGRSYTTRALISETNICSANNGHRTREPVVRIVRGAGVTSDRRGACVRRRRARLFSGASQTPLDDQAECTAGSNFESK